MNDPRSYTNENPPGLSRLPDFVDPSGISDEFDAANVSCDLDYQPPVSGQRRMLAVGRIVKGTSTKNATVRFPGILQCFRVDESVRPFAHIGVAVVAKNATGKDTSGNR